MPEKLKIDLQKLEALASRGSTRAEAAADLGLKLDSFNKKLQNDEMCNAAWKRGKAKAKSAPDAEAAAVTSSSESLVFAIISRSPRSMTEADIATRARLSDEETERALERLESAGRITKSLVGDPSDEVFTYRVSTKTTEAHTPEVVSESRIAGAVEASKPVERNVTPRAPRKSSKKAGRKGKGRKGTAKKSMALARRPVHAHLPSVETRGGATLAPAIQRLPVETEVAPALSAFPISDAAKDDALQAAQVEIQYSSYWQHPSPKAVEVLRKIARAIAGANE